MLFISFCIIFTCKKAGDEIKNKYFKKDCEKYAAVYADNEGLVNDEHYKAWYKIAEEENDLITKEL